MESKTSEVRESTLNKILNNQQNFRTRSNDSFEFEGVERNIHGEVLFIRGVVTVLNDEKQPDLLEMRWDLNGKAFSQSGRYHPFHYDLIIFEQYNSEQGFSK